MKTILVVDDDSRVRNIIRLIFEPLNYRVVATQNGKDAALKAREIKHWLMFLYRIKMDMRYQGR